MKLGGAGIWAAGGLEHGSLRHGGDRSGGLRYSGGPGLVNTQGGGQFDNGSGQGCEVLFNDMVQVPFG